MLEPVVLAGLLEEPHAATAAAKPTAMSAIVSELERRLRALAPCQPEATARTITDDNNHLLDTTDDGCPQCMAFSAVRRRYRRAMVRAAQGAVRPLAP